MHTLDPSVERRLAGQYRLDNFRLSAVMRGGIPSVQIGGSNSGTTTVGAPGCSLELLAEASAAFNAVVLHGGALDRVAAWLGDGAELQAKFAEGEINVLLGEAALQVDRTDALRAAYIGSDQHRQDDAIRAQFHADSAVAS